MRFTPSRTAWLLSAAALVAVSSCTDNQPAAPQLDVRSIKVPPTVPPGPPADAGKPPASVTVAPSTATVDAGSSVQLTALVLDKKGAPLAGRPVDWTSTNGGSFNPASSTTNASGQATTTFTASTVAPRVHVVTATSGGRTGQSQITTIVGEPANIALYSGDGGTEQVGATRTVSVLVTDANGNPVSGHEVIWRVTDGLGGVGSSDNTTTNTNSSGIASVQWTMGPLVETQELEALSYNPREHEGPALAGTPVTFTITTVPGPAAEVFILDPRNVPLNGNIGDQASFATRVEDAYGNVISNPALTWSSTNSGVTLTPSTGGTVTATLNTTIGPTTITITAAINGHNDSGTITIAGGE